MVSLLADAPGNRHGYSAAAVASAAAVGVAVLGAWHGVS